MNQYSRRQIGAILPALGIAVGLACAAGCARSREGQSLRPEDFAGSEGGAAVATRPSAEAAVVPGKPLALRFEPEPSEVVGPFGAREGIFDVGVSVGEPSLPDPEAPPVPASGEAVLVEAKIGEINNKAVYATDFLEPMGARLASEAIRLRGDAWRRFARTQIKQELERQIEDELLRSEAIAKLKPEERQGLASWLEGLREEQIRRNRGSATLMERSLQEERGVNSDQFLRTREQEELIKLQLREQVKNRVQVSRRDIELAYEKSFKDFNPDPNATVRWIHIPADQTDAIAEVRAALESGEDFVTVASRPVNQYNAKAGGLRDPVPLVDGDPGKTEFFGIEPLNVAAQTLSEGRFSGPIEYQTGSGRKFVGWVFMEKIERKSVPMYEAQLQLERVLREYGESKRRKQYIDELKSRASFTNIDEMTDRLLTIAEERYGPGSPGAAEARRRAAAQRELDESAERPRE